jgi:flagellar motility protein MotE (MotC chaperone)
MKGKIIYAVVFGGAFVLITLIMIVLNNDFKNVYAFDFSPVKPAQVTQSQVNPYNYKEAFGQMLKELKSQMLDSIKTIKYVTNDSVQNRKADSILTDSINILKTRLENTVNQDSLVKSELLSKNNVKSDSTYRIWTKKTAALYEAMDSKKAAKIIQNYSDNVARDILYSMKKKKAAEVLANLNPETANRMTRIQ